MNRTHGRPTLEDVRPPAAIASEEAVARNLGRQLLAALRIKPLVEVPERPDDQLIAAYSALCALNLTTVEACTALMVPAEQHAAWIEKGEADRRNGEDSAESRLVVAQALGFGKAKAALAAGAAASPLELLGRLDPHGWGRHAAISTPPPPDAGHPDDSFL